MSEDIRLNAVLTARRCACRGFIVGPEKVGKMAAEAVELHRQQPEHQGWDREAWIAANTATVDIPVAQLRKIA